MAHQLVCDQCGTKSALINSKYLDKPDGWMQLEVETPERNTFHLCPACAHKFTAFDRMKTEAGNVNADS